MNTTKPIKIALLTAGDPTGRHAYSGIYYSMIETLRRHGFEVTIIGPLKRWEETLKKNKDSVQKAAGSFIKIKFNYLFTPFVARQYAVRAQKKLKGKEFDFILAPNAFKEIAYLKTKIPVIYINDYSWNLIVDYYTKYTGLTKLAVKLVDKVEKRAIHKAALIIHPTQWVADSAIKHYGAHTSKVSVVPWGPNIDSIPGRIEVLSRQLSDKCRLFFLGVSWERKGGEIAFETLLELEKLGINAHLTIVGCEVPKEYSHPRMETIRFLDKNNEQHRKRLDELFKTSDFFFLPTRAECYGIVYNEAAAYGLPVITTDTGGVSCVVKEGVNGHLLPVKARGDQYAMVIKEICSDKVRYDTLVHNSRNQFEKYLNWDTWTKTFGEKLHAYQAAAEARSSTAN